MTNEEINGVNKIESDINNDNNFEMLTIEEYDQNLASFQEKIQQRCQVN
jgi:hypothetical protein